MRIPMINVILCLLCGALASPSFAGDDEGGASLNGGHRYVDRIDGLVIDQTITPLGHEFYRAFVNAWREQRDGSRYSVIIYERPSVRSASLLWVEYRFRKIYSGFVRMSRRSVLDGMGANAAQVAYQHIVEIEAETLTSSQDMASDEL